MTEASRFLNQNAANGLQTKLQAFIAMLSADDQVLFSRILEQSAKQDVISGYLQPCCSMHLTLPRVSGIGAFNLTIPSTPVPSLR